MNAFFLFAQKLHEFHLEPKSEVCHLGTSELLLFLLIYDPAVRCVCVLSLACLMQFPPAEVVETVAKQQAVAAADDV